VLTLAFDTATSVATTALVRDGTVVGERVSRAVNVLEGADELLRDAGYEQSDLTGLAVGTGPGSFTGLRLGLAAARGLSFALGLQVAGVSTLMALTAGAPGSLPVIDAGRREVFSLGPDGPFCANPHELALEPGTVCVGDGAVRYRAVLESGGAEIPPDGDERHLPRARFHAALARDFGPADEVEPLYLRVPDAEARKT
jgi:tRNA threonylcarbamoyladenosine biosynthesis protein TsaB